MNEVESSIVAYLNRRLEEGALAVPASEIMEAVIPPDQPKLRYQPKYKYALERLLRRMVVNAVDAHDGTRHYYIGNCPSPALRKSLGIGD